MNRWFLDARRGWRFAVIAWGVALLAWLPFEDTDTRMVMVFALSGCLLGALRFLPARGAKGTGGPGAGYSFWRELGLYVVGGALAGLGAGPVAVLLMAVKSGLHIHPVPDFSAMQIVDVLLGAPVWITAGSLTGLGAWFFEASHGLD